MKLAQDVKSMDPETLKSHVRRMNDATPISWDIEWKKAHKVTISDHRLQATATVRSQHPPPPINPTTSDHLFDPTHRLR